MDARQAELSIIGREVKCRIGQGVVVREGARRAEGKCADAFVVRMRTGCWSGREVVCNASAVVLT